MKLSVNLHMTHSKSSADSAIRRMQCKFHIRKFKRLTMFNVRVTTYKMWNFVSSLHNSTSKTLSIEQLLTFHFSPLFLWNINGNKTFDVTCHTGKFSFMYFSHLTFFLMIYSFLLFLLYKDMLLFQGTRFVF